MAVFFDSGCGDFYGGSTRESVIEAMKEEIGEADFYPDLVMEVPGTSKVAVLDEYGERTGESTTLEAEYDESLGSYCVASENC